MKKKSVPKMWTYKVVEKSPSGKVYTRATLKTRNRVGKHLIDKLTTFAKRHY